MVDKMITLNEWETLEYIEAGGSVGRFGDGELRWMNGAGHAYNTPNKEIREKLVKILENNHENYISCIPTIFGNNIDHIKEGRGSWIIFKRDYGKKVRKWLKADLYGSMFISRMDCIPSLNTPEYFDRWKNLTKNKKVLGISGRHFSLNEYKDLYKIDYELKVPSINAWKHELNFKDIKGYDLVILSCGFAATLWAYEISKQGIQAIDVGKLGRGYLDGSMKGYKENKRGGYPW